MIKVNSYSALLNEDFHTVLVKEKELEYNTEEKRLDNPDDIYFMMCECFNLNKKAEEYAYVLCYNNDLRLLGVFELSHGTVSFTALNPREVYMRALLCGATSIIILHNHPTGNINPSKEDIEGTDRIRIAGNILGIHLNDHIIIGNNSYTSFLKEGLI